MIKIKICYNRHTTEEFFLTDLEKIIYNVQMQMVVLRNPTICGNNQKKDQIVIPFNNIFKIEVETVIQNTEVQ